MVKPHSFLSACTTIAYLKRIKTPDFPGASEVKASACNAGDLDLIPGLGRSPGEGNGKPLQYSCLENPMDGGAWWVTVHGVTKSRTQLSHFTFTFTRPRRRLWCDTEKQWSLLPLRLIFLSCVFFKSDVAQCQLIWIYETALCSFYVFSVLLFDYNGVTHFYKYIHCMAYAVFSSNFLSVSDSWAEVCSQLWLNIVFGNINRKF